MANESIGVTGRTGERAVLREVDIDVQLVGPLQETRVAQIFRNDSGHNIEAVYTFPLPSAAVLLDMEVELGETVNRGTVVRRQEAESRYEDALEQGHSAFRLQQLDDGLYCASLGNLIAGETARIRYRYAMTLAWQGDSLNVRVPTTLAPRYGEPLHLEPYERPSLSPTADYRLGLSVTVHGDLARATISCPTHRVTVSMSEDCITVTVPGDARLDRDFVLTIAAAAQQPTWIVAPDGPGYATMLSCVPRSSGEDRSARSVMLMIDCSGSMAGDSIRQAKDALRRILGQLRPADIYNILAFGSQRKLFAAHFVPASTGLSRGQEFIDALDADLGGTELARALYDALEMRSEAPNRDILLVTDGQVWLSDRTFEQVQRAGQRIFTVGVGSAVAEGVVRRLADCSGGAWELVTPNDDMAPRIARHFSRIYQRRLQDTHVTWPDTAAWETRSASALFAGDTWTVFAGFRNAPRGMARIDVDLEGEGHLTNHAPLSSLVPKGIGADTLPRLAAAARLVGLPPEQATQLAIDYQLVTADTDYLLVVERDAQESAKDMPRLHIVDTMLAAGWGGSGSVRQNLEMPAVLRRTTRHHDGISFELSMQSLDIECSETAPDEIPTFLRRVGPDAFAATVFGKEGDRWGLRSAPGGPLLPDTLAQLPLDRLPVELADRLRELVSAGNPEADVVVALLLVLRDSLGVHLDASSSSALDGVMATHRPDARLMRRIESVLQRIADPAWQRSDRAGCGGCTGRFTRAAEGR